MRVRIQEKIASFSAFRFLYERLLGADVRPLLPSVFCSAAALPQIRPNQRKVLLQSLSEAAATAPGWSTREPFVSLLIPKSFLPPNIHLALNNVQLCCMPRGPLTASQHSAICEAMGGSKTRFDT